MFSFPLGQIVATPGALAALERANQPPTCFSPFNANGFYAATAGKFIRAHGENLVGCWPAIWFASAIRS